MENLKRDRQILIDRSKNFEETIGKCHDQIFKLEEENSTISGQLENLRINFDREKLEFVEILQRQKSEFEQKLNENLQIYEKQKQILDENRRKFDETLRQIKENNSKINEKLIDENFQLKNQLKFFENLLENEKSNLMQIKNLLSTKESEFLSENQRLNEIIEELE
uniref:Uncharacterized protein n=1 Tax=Romanomermis culicivorax TaxID=13658 RepID=A0A915KUV3_ROMCU